MWHYARLAHRDQPRSRLGLARLAALLVVGGLTFNLALAGLAHAATPQSLTVSSCGGDATVPGTLPYEVAQANSDHANDTIQFALDCDGTVANPMIALSATLKITSSMTINGNGHGVILDGGSKLQDIQVQGGFKFILTLTLTDLIIQNGTTAGRGGGIDNEGGTVTLNGIDVRSSSANQGGGGIANTGTLTLDNSLVVHNSTLPKPGSGGSNGGGIANIGSGRLTLTNSGVASNKGINGGGIYNESGTVSLANSNLVGDNGLKRGGGIYNGSGAVSLTNSYLFLNSALLGGGGIYNGSGTVSLTNSTVESNESTENGAGGGIGNGGALTLANSTIAKNKASQTGGGIANVGTLSLSNSTIAQNDVSGTSGSGGGIANAGSVRSSGSILAGNTATSGANCINYTAKNTITDQGYNLESAADCQFSGAGSLQNTDPKFVTDGSGNPLLTDNGGPTPTMALLPSSPASDQIPAASCPTADQRGISRPDNGEAACDIGAYESLDPRCTDAGATGPAFLGLCMPGQFNDTSDDRSPTGSQITTGATTETVTSICAGVGPLDPNPANDTFGVAIYTDVAGAPGTLVANSLVGTLTTANGFNCLPMPAGTVLSANTSYWLMYDNNGDDSGFTTQNDLTYNLASSQIGGYSSLIPWPGEPGVWLSPFVSFVPEMRQYAVYANVTP